MEDRPDDRETGRPEMPQTMSEQPEKRGRPDMRRKEELFQLAKGIAAQVGECTKRHERCLLRSMIEMLLDN